MTDLTALLEVFDAATVHRLATDRVIQRGTSYQNRGAVTITALTPTSVTADVDGTHRYEVLFDVSEHPDWSCTCPAAADGDFCKHCVALALELAMIDAGEADPPMVLPADAQPDRSPSRRSGRPDQSDERQRLVDHLEQLPAERLVELLVDQTERDWSLRERLLLEADAGREQLDLDRWIQRVDEATFVDDYIDWREADGWASNVYFVLDAIDDLLLRGQAAAVIALTEHAFRSVERVVGYVDDSNSGCLRDLSERIGELHLRACEVQPPDPVALARSLVDLELNSDLEGLYHAVDTYSELLGDAGLAEYGRLLDALGNGGNRSDRAYTLKSMRRAYAAAVDDVDVLVAELGRDAGPGDIEEIIEALVGAGRVDEAIEAGRTGLSRLRADQYGAFQTSGVIDALAPLLRDHGHSDEAVALYRDAFEAAPSTRTLGRYLDAVDDEGDPTLEAAIAHVRGRVGKPRGNRRAVPNETLIDILVWAGRHEDAWDAATSGGCLPGRWLELARHRETSHPIDAIDVYEPQIFRAIGAKNNKAYA
ncbi:MAG: SWIM zinc finger family protein, partial [Ilumatobacter sp.]|nr:SWIM zinc finger family protein [Ilumatobacter sp.]